VNTLNSLSKKYPAVQDYSVANEKLIVVYKKLLARINDPISKKSLQTAQTAWCIYRDKNAKFEASFYEGGTMQPIVLSNCLTTMTEKRTVELQHILDTET